MAQAINLLGGVDIELSDNEFSFINAFITEVVENTGIPSVQLTHAGLNHLDGVQAVAYGPPASGRHGLRENRAPENRPGEGV